MTTAAQILNPPSNDAPPAAPLPGAVSTPVAPPATPQGWWDSFKDGEVKSWAANKNYQDPEMLAASFRSLESVYGADKAGRTVVLPKDDNDAEGWKSFRAKLGVPETPDGYKLPLPDGDGGTFAKTASNWFHEAGVPPKAAEKIASAWNNYIADQVKAGQESDAKASEAALGELRAEWGPNYDSNVEMARRANREIAAQAGLEDADLQKLESGLGTAKMLKLFAKLGEYVAESHFQGGNTSASFGMTPDRAREELNQITADRAAGRINDYAWRTEFGPKMEKLIGVITGGKAA